MHLECIKGIRRTRCGGIYSGILFCDSSSCLALIIPLQDLVKATLANLTTLSLRIQSLSLFSPNDTLEDISTKDLIYLLVPFVSAEVKGRLKTIDREERISVLRETQVQSNTSCSPRLVNDTFQQDYMRFLQYLDNYGIVTEDERTLYEQPKSNVLDASRRREIKIRQYQKEKDLRSRIDV